jgi:AcrR family transcriptional regulator
MSGSRRKAGHEPKLGAKAAKIPIDRCVVHTRALLHDALLTLIGEKRYEAITIEEICARANIGRSTFYAHYKSKEDLIRGGLKNIRMLMSDRPVLSSGSEGDQSGALSFSLPLFRHARDHMHLHRVLVGGRGAAIARDTVQQILCEQLRREPAILASNGKDAMPRELVVQFLAGAYMAVANWWLDHGASLDPERMDALFQRLAAEGVPDLRGELRFPRSRRVIHGHVEPKLG